MVGKIVDIKSNEEFFSIMAESGRYCSLIYFKAKWCPPCTAIVHHIEVLAYEIMDVPFYRIDVDECPDIAELFRISGIPQFIFIINDKIMFKVTGPKLDLIQKYLFYLMWAHLQYSTYRASIGFICPEALEIYQHIRNVCKLREFKKFAMEFDSFINEGKGTRREIDVSSTFFTDVVMAVPGLMDYILKEGFAEDEDKFKFPFDQPVQNFLKFRDTFAATTKIVWPIRSITFDQMDEFYLNRVKNTNTNLKSLKSQLVFTDYTVEMKKFYNKVLKYLEIFCEFKESKVMKKLVKLIPDGKRTRAMMSTVERFAYKGTILINDMKTLVDTMDWFKKTYFSWFNGPTECEKCCLNDFISVCYGDPNESERRYNCDTVELYRCKNCNHIYRFPRYNSVLKLIKTRIGRCGEWAICFAAFCTALNFRTRFAIDWSDHIWTEVYSYNEKRWIHFDPCENLFDKPLLYELGWKKKLSYVIGVSIDEVVDLTWNYVQNYSETKSRRSLVSEKQLNKILYDLNSLIFDKSSNHPLNSFITECQFDYMIDLIDYKREKSTPDDLGGRISGDIDWRRIRGEAENN